MAKLKDLFPSNYLGVADFSEKGEVLQINKVEIKKIKDATGVEKMKPCLHFVGYVKPLVVNKTNAKRIEKLYGDETDEWEKKKIGIRVITGEAFGEEKEMIQLYDPNKKPTKKEDDAA